MQALVLKGPPLSRRLYGDVGMRMVNDLDLLVAPKTVEASLKVLRSLGYASDTEGNGREPDLHEELQDPLGRLARVDLHWRIHWYENEFSVAMLERSEKGGADVLRQALPEDELAALLLYYARDGFYGLRMAADIAGWWDRYGGDSRSEPVLADVWEQHPNLRRALAAGAIAAEETVGVPAHALVPSKAPGRVRTRMAVRLGNWSQVGDLDQLASNVELIDALLGPASQLGAFIRRQVLLTPGQIAAIYDVGPRNRLWLSLLRVLHVPKVLVRYLLGLVGALAARGGPSFRAPVSSR